VNCSALQCVAVCCSDSGHAFTQFGRCVAACGTVLQFVAVYCSVAIDEGRVFNQFRRCVAVRSTMLQCVPLCCSVLHDAAVRCSALQCVAVCCNMLQYYQ